MIVEILAAASDEALAAYILVVGALIIILCVAVFVFTNRCPKCKRFCALKETGNLKTEKGRNVFGRTVLTTYRQYRCRYCGHEKWRKEQPLVRGGPPFCGG